MRLSVTTAKKLIDMKIVKFPTLVEDLFPLTGLVVVSGPSDSGKTTLMRQLAIEIVTKKSKFLNLDLNAKHKRVIYISTEDDENAISYLLNKYQLTAEEKQKLKNLIYIFDTEKVVEEIEKILTVNPVDLIIVDAFTDLYVGDLNMSNKVREFLNKFRGLTLKYDCLVIFVHHPNKRADHETPNKNSLLGSQGIEAKARLVVDFRKEKANPDFRRLYITKGNYMSDDKKNVGFRLKMNENMRYEVLDNKIALSGTSTSILENLQEKNKKIERVHELKNAGKSTRETVDIMGEEGLSISIGSVSNYLKMACSTVHTPTHSS